MFVYFLIQYVVFHIPVIESRRSDSIFHIRRKVYDAEFARFVTFVLNSDHFRN